MISQMPEASQVSFFQGPLGQKSPKPTRFLTLRLPWMQRAITALSEPRLAQAASSHSGEIFEVGPDCKKRFDTASLKVYAPRLCGAMALTFWAAFAMRIHPEHVVSAEFNRLSKIIAARCDGISESSTVVHRQDNDILLPKHCVTCSLAKQRSWHGRRFCREEEGERLSRWPLHPLVFCRHIFALSNRVTRDIIRTRDILFCHLSAGRLLFC